MDQRLKAAYSAQLVSPNATLSQSQAKDVIETLMAHFLSLEYRSGYAMTPEEAQKERFNIEKHFGGWVQVPEYIKRSLQKHAESSGAPLSFADTKSVAQSVMDQYEKQP